MKMICIEYSALLGAWVQMESMEVFYPLFSAIGYFGIVFVLAEISRKVNNINAELNVQLEDTL